MTSHELGPLMRCLGANPKEDHLQELMNEVDYDGNYNTKIVQLDLMQSINSQTDFWLSLTKHEKSI